ncbi:MAG: GNAT family N-acetyltransferase [Pseudomonadales bacterium]|nr:GNAT family N-acetyltransferase [Pseudomonadales bacterium]
MNIIPTSNIDQPAEHDIYVAGDAEIAQVCKLLASAFTDDPVLGWLSGQPKIYDELFRSQAEALYKHHGQVYINREQTGAAMWLPAGVSAKPPFHWRMLTGMWSLACTGGLKSLRRGGILQKIMAEHHPNEPHFYLHAIGASIENQGRGIGSALIKAGLDACDQQGMPAYLESTNEKNNPLYERYGFEVVGEATLPEGGPGMWFMHREARTNR